MTLSRIGRLSWIGRVLISAFAGATVRTARRVRGEPPRTWHGPQGLHTIRGTVQATRAAGLPSRSVIKSIGSSSHKLFRESEFDRVLDLEDVPGDQLHWAALCDLLRHGDVWFAYFDSQFFPMRQRRINEMVFALVRLVGIRIVVMSHGMDVLYRTASTTRFDWVGRAQRDYPDWDLEAAATDVIWRTDLFCRRSDVVIADPVSSRFMPRCDLNFKWLTIDSLPAEPAARAPNRVPVIVHAPQHRFIKGTDALLEAVSDLTSRGFAVDLRLIEKMSRSEALEAYANADIVADQFIIGSYGMFALEGMALAKPVLTYLDEEHLGNPVYDLPLINANPENLREVLAVLLRVAQLRTRLGTAARQAVERLHTPAVMSEVWREIAMATWQRRRPSMDGTRHFSGRRARAFTENPADADFWPVPVADIHSEIHEALNDARN